MSEGRCHRSQMRTYTEQETRSTRTEPDDLFSGDAGAVQTLFGSGFSCRMITDHFNQRLNVLSFSGDVKPFIRQMVAAASRAGLDKIIVKAAEDQWEEFISYGFGLEGLIKKYFGGQHAYHMAKFLSGERRFSQAIGQEDEIVERLTLEPLEMESEDSLLPDELTVRAVGYEAAQRLAALYGRVFDTYPTPMNDPEYIKTTMNEGSVFYAAYGPTGEIVSAASAAVSAKHSNAEMTDCATLADYRGKGLMTILLQKLEEDMYHAGVGCLYSMARSRSFGMNKVFRRLGYRYSGRLINHCNIMGRLEDMNLWVKIIQ